MTTSRPLILFTGPSGQEKRILPYKDAIEGSGGELLMVPESAGKDEIDRLLLQASGILFPGGADINPALYGEAKQPYTEGIDDVRDAREMHVLARAIERKIPTLAICRGVQILNVYLGGTLYQDVEKEMPGGIRHDWHIDEQGNELPRARISHSVRITEGSLLHAIIGAAEIPVNSLHHQGLRRLGRDLIVSAVAPDGLVEAVEVKDHPFFIAIQWHPEGLYFDPVWKRLFDALIRKAELAPHPART